MKKKKLLKKIDKLKDANFDLLKRVEVLEKTNDDFLAMNLKHREDCIIACLELLI